MIVLKAVRFKFLAEPVVPDINLRFPSDNEQPLASGVPPILSTEKLFVGLSFTASPVTKLFGVKLLPLPDESLPIVVADVPELSEKFK